MSIAHAEDFPPVDNTPASPDTSDDEKQLIDTEPYYSSEPNLGGSGYSETFNTSDKKIDYTAIAEALRAGCKAAQTDRSAPFPVAVVYLDAFFIIQGEAAKWLPPYPKKPNATIHGVDADGDCVRDDIEHYIAKKYGGSGNYKLRKYLYEYTAWMDWFLIAGLSVNTARTAFNNMAAAGECVSRIIGENEARDAIDDLFAKFHNTWPRSDRYIDNLPRLGGWTTRENQLVSCP